MASAGDVLSPRALNRATLQRQLLLRRSALPAIQAVEHLVGLQAQVPNAPYFGLWTRLEGFRHDHLAGLITERKVVRIALMRGTIHLVTARDCLALRPVLQPVQERGLSATLGPRIAELDVQEIAFAGRALVEQQPRTFNELGKLLSRRWPDLDAGALAVAVRLLLPLVQVPPRGIWGASGPAAHTTAEAWLGRPLDDEPSPDQLVLRYLAAFGPASVKDLQTWSGLTRLGEITGRLRDRLRTFRDEDGNKVLDLPDAPRPDPDTPAPARFLPEYDNSLRSHANRARIMTEDARRLLHSRNDSPKPTLLVDGFVGGIWKLARQRGTATLLVQPFQRLSKKDTAAVAREGAQLLAFAAADTDSPDIQFVTTD